MISNKKPNILILFAAVLFILSCAPFAVGTGLAESPQNKATPSLSPSATSAITATAPSPTASAITTPSLLPGNTWGFSRIAFASNRTGKFQIYLMRPDGSKVVQITQAAGENTSPSWSPDAKHIVFVSTRDDGTPQIFVMNPDGSAQTEISQGQGNNSLPIFLPDGRIAYVSDRKGLARVFVINADGTGLQAYPTSSVEAGTNFLCLTSITDGVISFTTDRAGARSVQLLDLKSGADSAPLILNTGHDRSCPLVPSLKADPWVVFQTNRDGNEEIYKYDLNNNGDVQLTSHSTASQGATISSSEDWLAFASKRTGNWEIYVTGLDGKYQYDISNNPYDDIEPAWEPY